jgi:putative DNA primase/helicase
VLLLTAEDAIADTVIPRFVAAHADLDCVHIVKMVKQGNDKRRMFSLVTDLDLLREKRRRQSQRAPVDRRSRDTLAAQGAGRGIARFDPRHRAFHKKADVKEAMLRIADSLAYVAAARHCYVVVVNDDGQHLFVKAKNTLAPDTKALGYRIDVRDVGTDKQLGTAISASYIKNGAESTSM